MYVPIYWMFIIGFLVGLLFSGVALIIASVWFNNKKKR